MPETIEQTATTASTESAGGSYVQSILGPAGEFGADEQPVRTEEAQTQQAATAETDRQTQTATEQAPPVETATLEELIQQYAKETGLNPDDPNQRKTLKRLADKELFIRQLQASKPGEAQAGTAQTPELLTDFEKSLMEESKPAEAASVNGQQQQQAASPQQSAPAQQAAPPEPMLYNDIGDSWKSPEDALSALNEAWTQNDLKKVHRIEEARLKRSFDTQIAPSLLGFVERMVEKRLQQFTEKDLGDVLPKLKLDLQQQRLGESREFAVNELRKAGAENIDALFVKEDGPPITFDGQEFPNTPLNRILVKFPGIMQIKEHHDDAAKAERKTFIARYKMAYQIHQAQQNGGVPADTARKLMEAGAGVKAKQVADRARQAINAGSGASGLGETGAESSYVKSLNNLPGEVPFSSLLS